MTESTPWLRRCAVLMLQAQERISYRPEDLIAGRLQAQVDTQWMALAPHRDEAVAVDADEIAALGRCSSSQWQPAAQLGIPAEIVASLCTKGLLLCRDADAGSEAAAYAERDELLRGLHWRGLSAVAHVYSRWQGIDARAAERQLAAEGLALPQDPPPPAVAAGAQLPRLPLPVPAPTALESLLLARTTCRNFREPPLSLDQLGHVLQRAFAARAQAQFSADLTLLKKGVPSAGGLHPVEPCLLLRRVAGLAPGLYRYDAIAHALLLHAELTPQAADALAQTFVAGQEYFAAAPVLLALVARFARNFWKYRDHPKAWRAVVLDAGHLSQALYLAATEQELGAFITAAVNEADIEQAFGLDPLQHGVIAVCGFGPRGAAEEIEFDPLRRAAGRDVAA